MLVDAEGDSLISSHEPPRLTRTPPSTAMRMDAAAVVLIGLTGLETLTGPVVPFWKRTVELPSIPFLLGLFALVVVIRHLVFRGTTVWDTAAVWRDRLDRRPDVAAAFRAFVATRPAVFLVAHFAVVTFGLAPTMGRILSRRSIQQPAGAIRRRLVCHDCDRRLPMGRAVHEPGEHRVLSRAAGADAVGGADHRLARAGRDAGQAHAPRAVGRRVHLARVVLRRADLPVPAEPASRRRRTPPRRRRCCSPPIRSPRSSTRRIRKGCSFSAPSAPSITSIASSGLPRRCSGCSSA